MSQPSFQSSHVPASSCPVCKARLDYATEADIGGDHHSPVPGDTSICIECGTINEYGPDMHLVEAPPARVLVLMMDPRVARAVEVLKQVKAVVLKATARVVDKKRAGTRERPDPPERPPSQR